MRPGAIETVDIDRVPGIVISSFTETLYLIESSFTYPSTVTQ